jgi:16S rRNA (guanine966-N2)-methyltransferase
LFSTLQALRGPLDGARVADLYAGSGAVGLEALSRGASAVLLVESSPKAVAVVRRNIEVLDLPGARVVAAPVERLVSAAWEEDAYDVVFLDPPYALADDRVRRVLADLRTHGWLAPEAVVAVERATRSGGFRWPEGFEPLRERRYGEGTLWYARA